MRCSMGLGCLITITLVNVFQMEDANAADQAANITTESPALIGKTGSGEGPAWHPQLGLLTSGGGHILRLDRDGKTSIYRENAGTNGLLFDRQGRLLMCVPKLRQVARLEADGTVTVLAKTYEGMKFNQPNDLALDSQNRLYFTDPQYGDRSSMEMKDAQGRFVEGVYRIDAPGKATRILGQEVDRPNGIAVTPDDKFLYVADNNNNVVGGARKLWRFELLADGTVKPNTQTLLYDWEHTRGPDGMKLDREGRIYVAAGSNRQVPPYEGQAKPTAGVYVFSPEGKLLRIYPIPTDETTNCAFGGDDLKTLYITSGGSLYSVRVTVPGNPAWPVPSR